MKCGAVNMVKFKVRDREQNSGFLKLESGLHFN